MSRSKLHYIRISTNVKAFLLCTFQYSEGRKVPSVAARNYRQAQTPALSPVQPWILCSVQSANPCLRYTSSSIVRPMQTRVCKVGIQAMCERYPRSTHMLSKAGIGRPWTVRFTEHVAHLYCASVSALMRVRGYELMGRLTSEL
jgi:hypothetical protein